MTNIHLREIGHRKIFPPHAEIRTSLINPICGEIKIYTDKQLWNGLNVYSCYIYLRLS